MNKIIWVQLSIVSSCTSSKFRALMFLLSNISLSLRDDLEMKLFPTVPISNREIERSPKYLILGLCLSKILSLVLISIFYLNSLSVHKWYH